jgi:hypothetical protein
VTQGKSKAVASIHVAFCHSCDWRAEHPTRDGAIGEALTHRGQHPGHEVTAPGLGTTDPTTLWLERFALALEAAEMLMAVSPPPNLALVSPEKLIADLLTCIADAAQRRDVSRAVGKESEKTYGPEAARIRAIIATRSQEQQQVK